jgi:L-ascorbate metabolism protein UlaG (beta-lactamase superfamily)
MTVDQAAAGVIAFNPKVVYPYHYRNADKTLSDVQRFAELVEKQGVSCELLDWYTEVQP